MDGLAAGGPGAGQRADLAGGGVAQLHRRGAQADDEPAVVPEGPGEVEAAVDGHAARVVGLAALPAHGVEAHGRQRQRGGEVLPEELGDGGVLLVVLVPEEVVAALQEVGVQRLDRLELGHRDQQIATNISHCVLDRALLVPRVGVAVGGRHERVGAERREELGLAHDVAGAAAGLGGVVEHALAGHPPDVLEDGLQALDHALLALRLGREAVAGVRVRPGDGEQVQLALDAGNDSDEVAVVDLADAGGPDELDRAVRVAGALVRIAPPAHEAQDRGVGARVAELLDHAPVDAHRRVALLGRGRGVGLEP